MFALFLGEEYFHFYFSVLISMVISFHAEEAAFQYYIIYINFLFMFICRFAKQ